MKTDAPRTPKLEVDNVEVHPLLRLKVCRRVGALWPGWCVIALEGTLEGRSSGVAAHCGPNTESTDLAFSFSAVVVAHETVVLFIVPLTAPDPPGKYTCDGKYDSTSDANDNANNRVASL